MKQLPLRIQIREDLERKTLEIRSYSNEWYVSNVVHGSIEEFIDTKLFDTIPDITVYII